MIMHRQKMLIKKPFRSYDRILLKTTRLHIKKNHFIYENIRNVRYVNLPLTVLENWRFSDFEIWPVVGK